MKKYLVILSLSLISILGFGQGSTSALQRDEIAAIRSNSSIATTAGATDKGIADSIKSNTQSSELYLKAINDSIKVLSKNIAVIKGYAYDGLANGIWDGQYLQETAVNNNTSNNNVLTRYSNGKFDSLKTAINTLTSTVLTSTNIASYKQDTIFKALERNRVELDSIRFGNLKRIRIREDSLQNGLTRVQNAITANTATLTYLSTLTKYNNDKWDSILVTQLYPEVSATITSVNTATAVTAVQVIGVGVYSLTLPTGTFQIQSVIITSSLQTASDAIRVYCFNGTQNLSTYTEGASFAPTNANMVEFKDLYANTSALHSTVNSMGINYCPLIGNTSLQSGYATYTGTLKVGITYNGSYTPSSNNVYYLRIRIKRIN